MQDRIIEIGCIEMDNQILTGRSFHHYINPDGREIHAEAFAVHGISNEQLQDKPKFADIADEFLEFINGAKLVAHNAMFDLGFINAELARIGQMLIDVDRIIDTLTIARRKHPMGPNTLDALCKRYGINNSHRTLHGALLDAEILADVYIELRGGKQRSLGLQAERHHETTKVGNTGSATTPKRPTPLKNRLTPQEKAAHNGLLAKIGKQALWLKK